MAGPEIRVIKHSTKTWKKRARTALKQSDFSVASTTGSKTW